MAAARNGILAHLMWSMFIIFLIFFLFYHWSLPVPCFELAIVPKRWWFMILVAEARLFTGANCEADRPPLKPPPRPVIPPNDCCCKSWTCCWLLLSSMVTFVVRSSRIVDEPLESVPLVTNWALGRCTTLWNFKSYIFFKTLRLLDIEESSLKGWEKM